MPADQPVASGCEITVLLAPAECQTPLGFDCCAVHAAVDGAKPEAPDSGVADFAMPVRRVSRQLA